jgi:uncharacterized protein
MAPVMQIPLQPLTDEEELLLQHLLQESHSAPHWYARGAFSAIACEPSTQDPTVWLPLVLGADVADPATLKSIFNLLLRDRFVIQECLALGEPLAPEADSGPDFVQFCKGFVRISQVSEPWQKDPEASALVLPLAVSAGYLRTESLRTVLPELGEDVDTWQKTQESELPARLLNVYAHFAPLRAKTKPLTSGGKVGRNEVCPCGSGRKFKKCCGSAQAS